MVMTIPHTLHHGELPWIGTKSSMTTNSSIGWTGDDDEITLTDDLAVAETASSISHSPRNRTYHETPPVYLELQRMQRTNTTSVTSGRGATSHYDNRGRGCSQHRDPRHQPGRGFVPGCRRRPQELRLAGTNPAWRAADRRRRPGRLEDASGPVDDAFGFNCPSAAAPHVTGSIAFLSDD